MSSFYTKLFLFILCICGISYRKLQGMNCITRQTFAIPYKYGDEWVNEKLEDFAVAGNKYLVLFGKRSCKACRIVNMETGDAFTLSDKDPIYEVKIIGDKIISRGIFVKIWNLKNGTLLNTLDPRPYIDRHYPSIFVDNEKFACKEFKIIGDKIIASYFNYACIWNLDDASLSRLLFHKGLVYKIIVIGDKIIAVSTGKTPRHDSYLRDGGIVKIWNFKGECLATMETSEYYEFVAANENILVTLVPGEYGKFQVWDLNNGRLLSDYQETSFPGVTRDVAQLEVINGNIITQSWYSDEGVIWDANMRKSGSIEASRSVPIVATKDSIVTALGDTAVIYDMNHAVPPKRLIGHEDKICAVTVAGNKVFTGSMAFVLDKKGESCYQTIKIWDLRDGMLLHTLCNHTIHNNIIDKFPRMRIEVIDNKIIAMTDFDTVTVWSDARPEAQSEAPNMLAFLTALHPRCGNRSPAQILSQYLMKEIGTFVGHSEPWALSPRPLKIRTIKAHCDQSCVKSCVIC